MKHVQLNVGNVFIVMGLAIVGVGATGAIAEYVSHLDVPVVSSLARGVRLYLGWSLHEASS